MNYVLGVCTFLKPQVCDVFVSQVIALGADETMPRKAALQCPRPACEERVTEKTRKCRVSPVSLFSSG